MIALLGIPLAMLIVGMCLLFGWVVPADKARQLREDIEDRLPRTPLSPYDHHLLPIGHWASLRATNDYWAARFTYQETNALADLDRMLAAVTLTYPPLEMLADAPDVPPLKPTPSVLDTLTVNELRDMPMSEYAQRNTAFKGGAGGSATTFADRRVPAGSTAHGSD